MTNNLPILIRAARQAGKLYAVLNELRRRHPTEAQSLLIGQLDAINADLLDILHNTIANTEEDTTHGNQTC